ncbi:Uncharacterized protein BP5553_07225 [Venustampulla echinocandica]|uniref:Uncharacterized protein n=1 Tax=Venustampulla echinocandica TaxID=2656787 RepID=A0A370TIV5_9HELO|nr:Uncharacterized protein BP5553_07225 [Venustampulla echinocandica]RDL35294.1 Uncharacterized protein BP5553_07225 [Venustampulla echinocandica]
MNPAAWSALTRRTEPDVYIPHPAPNAEVKDEEDVSKMGSFFSLLKTLIVPAIISLILYLVISYVIVPTWKRYRNRYSNYLPLDTISTRTTSLRQRVQGAAVRLLVPSAWAARWGDNRYTASAQDGSGSDFDDDEGEELYDVDDNRREALSLDARRGGYTEGRRLSRDLEEGFKDDSDDEDGISDDEQH